MKCPMPELSIIIVNYKNQDLILGCVRSIVEKEEKLSYEIIVVDNDSQDDSEAQLKVIYPELHWMQMGYNSGFGRANNVGMKAATGEYVLLLNSDVLVTETNTLFDCLNYLKQLPNSDETILGTRLVNEDGSYQETLRLSFPGLRREIRANAFYIFLFDRLLKRNANLKDKTAQKQAHYQSGEVAWINGAFLLLKRSEMEARSLYFDDDFFLYGEDTEWCWRAAKSGMTFYHWHEKELIHFGSASSEVRKQKVQQVMASDWLYIRKTRGFWYTLLTLIVIFKNQTLDAFLHFFAKIRGRKLSDYAELQKTHRKWIFELLKTYSIQILFRRKHSDERSFVINCYD